MAELGQLDFNLKTKQKQATDIHKQYVCTACMYLICQN